MNRTCLKLIIAALPCIAFSLADASAQDKQPAVPANRVVPIQERETQTERDARMKWWREARFGMFIHWGLYAEPAGYWKGEPVEDLGEWIMHTDKIPVADYKKLAATFNPTKFDAEAWVGMASEAGVKYIVITAKHHDGFAMFHSQVHPFNIWDATPFHRDPLKELAAACLKHGLQLGFYYSQVQDWTAPGGAAMFGHWDPAQDGSFAEYVEKKSLPQVKELLTNYAPFPSVLWFDTPTRAMTPELAGRFVTVLNEHPNLIWNNRLGGHYNGDTKTPEQEIPAKGYPGEDWETCMTINETWGYKRDDKDFKSLDVLLRNLIDIASKGGNYLLNVGPDETGTIPQVEVDRFLGIGRWLKVNGESIYGCGATVFGAEAGTADPKREDARGNPIFHPAWVWRCTTKPGKIYLHIFKWPDAPFVVPALPAGQKIARAYLLADPSRTVAFKPSGEDTALDLPKEAPDPIASVVVLETTSAP